MKIEKSNFVALLLEAGEENAAVLLARSLLPEEIDTDRDLEALVSFGLDRDQVHELAQLAVGTIDVAGAGPRRDELQQTISRRWADLVEDWVS